MGQAGDMANETRSLVSRRGPSGGATSSWYVAIACEATHPSAPGLRIALERLTAISVGRGDARRVTRNGDCLRLDLDDPYQSRDHFRLRRDAGHWLLEDAGSKNGTRVRGLRTPRRRIGDGDVIEAGSTFLVMRETPGPALDREVGADEPALLRTLHAPFEAELALVTRLAQTNLPILVGGESGSGKELAARTIHELSGRRGPLVVVNCGAIPAGLAEAELFGARKGAFSGAVADRTGLVQAADGGTLFLDEVAELPAPAQSALLRLLQEGEVRQIGSHKTVHVDVRVVAATHRDLVALVEREAFRGDLHGRLRGHMLTLPSLRDRREDLGMLCAALLGRIEGGGRAIERVAMRALFAHGWPGNVRELEHALRFAAAHVGAEIGLESLPEAVRAPKSDAGQVSRHGGGERRALIVRLLDENGGNLSAVARALGTSRSQLRRLAVRFGIDLARSAD
jgi:transcriptional regulator of acetoin/glycerol metabolism